MNKIGIVTINDYGNYGNRLQNYASQEILRSLGFEAETIVNHTIFPINDSKENYIFEKVKRLRGLKISEILKKIKYKSILNKKRDRFKKFTETYIKETDFVLSEENKNNVNDRYDFFVVGSDQVWNPYCRFGSSFDFLTFASSHKRIALAPSFGISKLPLEFEGNYKKWILEMEHLSVREKAGADIIRNLTGRDAVVLVDPTLMLNKEQWLSITKAATYKPKENYLLTYFLGDKTDENIKQINKIAREKNLKIVNLADMHDPKTYIVDPSEFLDYINSASLFVTDSFHGAVFSIIFEKPFVVFDRILNEPSMSSRIDTLLSTFKLNSRKWTNIKSTNDIFNVDFSHVPPLLAAERKKVVDYLTNSLG